MKTRLFSGLLLVILSVSLWGNQDIPSWQDSLHRGEEAFHRALENSLDINDLSVAEKHYKDALKKGADGWVIHYNLGNIEYLLDKAPYALLEYARAGYLSPGRKVLQENIATVKGLSEQEKSLEWLRPILFGSIYLLGYRNAYFWGLIFYLLAWGLLIAGKLLKKRSLNLTGVILLLLALWNTGLCYSWNHLYSRRGIVLAEKPALYRGDSRTYGQVVSESLKGGVSVTRLEERQGWSYVKLPDGAEGWMENSDFQMILLTEETLDFESISK